MGGALIQWGYCPYERYQRACSPHTRALRKGHVSTQREAVCNQGESSADTNPAGTLILAPSLQNCERVNLLSKPSGLWYFVIVAPPD